MQRTEQHGGLQGERRSSVSPAGPQDEGEQTESSFGTSEDCVPGNSSPQAKISSDLVKDKELRTESVN